jgi:hypothetical protein
MSIENKKEETLKLKEYIIMEGEKLEEARKTFEEDREKFNKYLTDMELQADRAKEANESFVKVKVDLNDELE